MEHVTDISLTVDGKEAEYRVLFHDEIYTFEPVNSPDAKAFSLRRDHNQWHCVDAPDSSVTKFAIAKLEAFLLSQH